MMITSSSTLSTGKKKPLFTSTGSKSSAVNMCFTVSTSSSAASAMSSHESLGCNTRKFRTMFNVCGCTLSSRMNVDRSVAPGVQSVVVEPLGDRLVTRMTMPSASSRLLPTPKGRRPKHLMPSKPSLGPPKRLRKSEKSVLFVGTINANTCVSTTRTGLASVCLFKVVLSGSLWVRPFMRSPTVTVVSHKKSSVPKSLSSTSIETSCLWL
mmetsp:Transcript_29738/g.81454  ORF Transcript_29738/g.81454 Transcript_29738/m.81454 type:complete len:210 (+) Transcript_29738:491-1120(+)